MPTYQYVCDVCGNEFEQFQSIKATPLRKCPSCGKNQLNRLIGTGGGIIFKGSGFYQTDYRSDSYKNAAKSASAAADTTSDSKKATKTSESASTTAKSEIKPAKTG